MSYDSFEDFQYDSCVSRGICSINPRTSALQTVLVLYLRLFAKYAIELDLNKIPAETKIFILNTVSMTIANPEFNDNTFLTVINHFRKILSHTIDEYQVLHENTSMDEERSKANELFEKTKDIIQAIQYGEKRFQQGQQELSALIRDLYNIILVIAKSLSLNLLDLETFGKTHEKGFETILNLLTRINLREKDVEILKKEICSAVKIDNELMKHLREAQEERYGTQGVAEVSYSTVPNKAILVVGSNIRELEIILEALKETEIDVYTHDDMMVAHTFPKFSEYKHLKGQFGQGMENCLLDFSTFPGPIILTKHSLHNIENLYRGRLFTTDLTTHKGVINIKNNDFSEVIESAYQSKGFKTGKNCETVEIGYNFHETIDSIKNRVSNYKRIFLIALEGYSLEQKVYFEKMLKLLPKENFVISFSYSLEKENILHINTCYDSYSMIKIFEEIKKLSLPITVFVPKCDKNSISQMIYLTEHKNTEVFVGKCTPIILNPSLMNTLQDVFCIKGISSAKKDLEQIFENE